MWDPNCYPFCPGPTGAARCIHTVCFDFRAKFADDVYRICNLQGQIYVVSKCTIVEEFNAKIQNPNRKERDIGRK